MLPSSVLTLAWKLKDKNKRFYVVGGFCRNQILGIKESEIDIDLVTDALPYEVKELLNVVWEVGKKYGTCLISEWGDTFELTTFRQDIGSINHRKPAEVVFTDSLELDAKRRDFTFNAIYFDPLEKTFIDPEGWKIDIENNIIRFVGNIGERIQEDALRILRFVRFKNKYSLQVADSQYWKILTKYTPLLKELPIERIRQELDKILLNPNNTHALEDLKRIGFLKLFLPELDCLDRFPWNKYHLEGNVWIHTKMCVDEMSKIVLRESITNTEKKRILLWGILLHDIGKAPTLSVWPDKEVHYYSHEDVWVDMFQIIASRFNFSNALKDEVRFLIQEHIRLYKIPMMKQLKARTLMMHPYFDDLLLIGEADNRGKIPSNRERFYEIQQIYSDFKAVLPTKVFFTWADVMVKYPELQWRQIGEKLRALNEIVLVRDEEE